MRTLGLLLHFANLLNIESVHAEKETKQIYLANHRRNR